MAKVALIIPGRNPDFAVCEPLNIGVIASNLEKHGHQVKIIDELAGEDVKKELVKFRPQIAGITATTPQAEDAYRVAGLAKKMGMLTVMGGNHASVMPQEALQYVDIVVKGEGEIAMLNIIKNKITEGMVTCDYIKDLDIIPPPSRHLMKMDFYLRTKDKLPDTYLYFVPPETKTAQIITSRGCPFACTFCHNSWRGLPYRFHSPQRVIKEITDLVEKYNIGALFFIEDDLFANKKRLAKICEMMKERKFRFIWGCNSRVDHIERDILKTAKEVNLKQVTFGFESGSQKVLDSLNKRTTVEQNKRAIELCKELDILVNGTFMIGSPDETLDDIKKTQDFILENDIDSVGLCITTPFPGTEIWNWCEQRGLIPDKLKWPDFNYQKIPILATETITKKELEKQYIKTLNLINSKKNIYLVNTIRTSLLHPYKTLLIASKYLRHPSKILTFFKRLSI